MALQIKTGKLTPPVRALIYSNAGFGKTSLASALPKPLFIDIEGSSERYNVSRIEAKTEADVKHVLNELIKDRQGFQTVVIDTADWLESAIGDAMCKRDKVGSIAECSGSFGKGFIEAGHRFGEILTLCDTLISKGMHVVFLAHSVVKKVSPPDQMESYDRYEIALDAKNFAAPLREWAEMILFGKFDTLIVKTKEKKIKAGLGEQSRTLYTTNSAAWDAKNRFNLPIEINIPAVEFGDDGTIPGDILPPELAAVFAGVAKPVACVAPVVALVTGDEALPPPPPAPISADQYERLTTYRPVAMCATIITAALDFYKCADIDDLTEAQAAKMIERCQEEMNKEPAKPAAAAGPVFPWQAAAREWLTANAGAVNTYLHAKGRVQAGQTWKDLHHEKAEKIAEHFDAFKAAVLGGAK